MVDPQQFDDLYRDSRERLLVQTYALTGDLSASRTAVRDAFVTTWHHWPKVRRAADPEASVRASAWGKARRRHGARPWHREKNIDAGARATLDALAGLATSGRRVLLLAHLASVSLDRLAEEVGQGRVETEQSLQSATSAFALARHVPASGVGSCLDALRPALQDVSWPRATIIRRAGVARRRTHTSVGVLAAVLTLVASGALVHDGAGVAPTLASAVDGAGVPSSGPSASTAPAPATRVEQPVDVLPARALLSAGAVARRLEGRGWAASGTSDNSAGTGLAVPCQQERYADPDGQAALVRRFSADKPEGGEVRPSVVQLSEASRSTGAARRAFRTELAWLGGCSTPRTQLIAVSDLSGVGEESRQVVLRSWAAPVSTSVVQVSRTGLFTTVVSSTVGGETAPDVDALARLQSAALGPLCTLEGAGSCPSGAVALEPATPPSAGEVPAMLGEVDLPPVIGVAQPWVGTEPRRALANAAATGCDRTSFSGEYDGASWRKNLSRTFLVPEADLPAEFGLTETIGSLPVPQASAVVDQVRAKLADCPDRDLGTKVTQVADTSGPDGELTAWTLTTEVSDQRSISFSMAVLRKGTSVAQVGFVPTGDVQMREGAFVALAERALARLAELPQRAEKGPRGTRTDQKGSRDLNRSAS